MVTVALLRPAGRTGRGFDRFIGPKTLHLTAHFPSISAGLLATRIKSVTGLDQARRCAAVSPSPPH